MGDTTNIEWAHRTFNSWEGCEKVQPECKHCYANDRDERFHGGGHWGPGSSRLLRVREAYWRAPYRWNEEARASGERQRVFCMSLGDFLEDRPELEGPRLRTCKIIEETPFLDWLILTKRPENQDLVPLAWQTGSRRPPNVWFGTSAGCQESADRNIPLLLAATWPSVYFVSAEPLLGPVHMPGLWQRWVCACGWGGVSRDLVMDGQFSTCPNCGASGGLESGARIGWVITGGESGKRRRPMERAWVRDLRDQCGEAGVAFFYKQEVDGAGKKISLPLLDERRHAAVPLTGGAL